MYSQMLAVHVTPVPAGHHRSEQASDAGYADAAVLCHQNPDAVGDPCHYANFNWSLFKLSPELSRPTGLQRGQVSTGSRPFAELRWTASCLQRNDMNETKIIFTTGSTAQREFATTGFCIPETLQAPVITVSQLPAPSCVTHQF